MPNLSCKCCGGMLNTDDKNPDINRCPYCKMEYPTAAAREFSQMMQAFDAHTREKIQKLLRRRHAVLAEEYISSAELTRVCDELLTLMPEDFLSGFYKIAAGSNRRALNRAIREIDVERYYDDIAEIVPFLMASMTADPDCQAALQDLVERAYKKRDPVRFRELSAEVTAQAEWVNAGGYETSQPRHVFVAYSSKDMPLVWELVEELEGQGLSCFVAKRNLRHGVGAEENYHAAIREAMDNCTSFVFVSTPNSRNFACDAFEIEMAYVMQQDKAKAPPDLSNYYESIPPKIKKPRVEYRVEESPRPNAADREVKLFFSGYEWAETPGEVADRVADQNFYRPNPMLTTVKPPRPVPTETEEERRAREAKEQAEAEKKAREAAEKAAAEEEARRKAEEAERKAKEQAEAERIAREAAEMAAAEEEARRKAEEAARLAAAEAERKAREKAEADRKAKEAAEQAKWAVGKTVTFGSYEQGSGKAPIEWQVLAKEGKSALLVSKYLLDQHMYHPTRTGVTWETCEIRKWLNGEFLQAAFNAGEQKKILQSTIQNPKNPTYGTKGGNTTTDRLFLLSIDEVKKYFPSYSARQAKATSYAKLRGVWVDDANGNSWWWLRSPGCSTYFAAIVYDGGVNEFGDHVYFGSGGLRPAMWVDISQFETTVEPVKSATPKPASVSSAPKLSPLSVPAVGGTFTFGSYEQTPGKGKEPIEWQVLAKEGKRALLISKYVLDARAYHKDIFGITWADCTLRKWLNGEFLQAAFNAGEQRRILQSTIQNPNNVRYGYGFGTNGGSSTTDRLFLLSIDEAEKYFSSDSARLGKPTAYAKSRGVKVGDKNGMSWWWLRSPGAYTRNAAYIDYDGVVGNGGGRVDRGSGGLRPAFWINLES